MLEAKATTSCSRAAVKARGGAQRSLSSTPCHHPESNSRLCEQIIPKYTVHSHPSDGDLVARSGAPDLVQILLAPQARAARSVMSEPT